MANSYPLKGVVLVDCARANAKQGLAIATERCGYGSDTNRFKESLIDACDEMGIAIDELSELIPDLRSRQLLTSFTCSQGFNKMSDYFRLTRC